MYKKQIFGKWILGKSVLHFLPDKEKDCMCGYRRSYWQRYIVDNHKGRKKCKTCMRELGY